VTEDELSSHVSDLTVTMKIMARKIIGFVIATGPPLEKFACVRGQSRLRPLRKIQFSTEGETGPGR
jgi:hypothetical protein